MQDPVVVAPRTRPFGDIADFYAALWSAVRETAERWHLAIVIEVARVIGWFAIRTVAGADGRTYLLWVIAAGVLALVAPKSGLVVFVATSVFFEPDSLARTLAPRELVVLPLAVGVFIRIAAERFRWRPDLAIWIGLALAGGTALGVVHSSIVFDDAVALHAAQSWIGNMAAPIIVLVAAAWTARTGSVRLLLVAVGVAVVASIVAMIERAAPGVVSLGPFGWVGFWKTFSDRLAGTVPSPNALSAQLIVPTAVALAAVILARDLRLKAAGLSAAIPLVVAHYLTFSRSPLLGGYTLAVIVAWRIRRWLGIAVLAAGIAGAAAFLPAYLQVRSQSAPEGAVTPGSILVASDEYRFRAWGAAISMWTAAPLTGQGYLAYKELGDAFGDPVLGSPHNEWLRLFAEEGIVVGVIGLLFIAAVARAMARIPGWLGTGLLGGWVAFVVAATFNNPFLFVRVTTVAFAMIGVGLALSEQARAASAKPEAVQSGDQQVPASPQAGEHHGDTAPAAPDTVEFGTDPALD
jgi:O-antigen ligase